MSSVLLYFIGALDAPTGNVLSRWRLRWQRMPHGIYIESHVTSIGIRPANRWTDGGEEAAADGRVDVGRLAAEAMALRARAETRRPGLPRVNARRVHLSPSYGR